MSEIIDPDLLFQRFLSEQTAAHADGLGQAVPEGLVTPFEDSPLRPLDARAAWTDAVAVVAAFPGVNVPAKWPAPPDWSAHLLALESAADVPLALGNFPQRVRSLTLLLQRTPAMPVPQGARPELVAWAQETTDPVAKLLGAGVLRLVGDFDAAGKLLGGRWPAALSALRANEQAALAWQRGDHAAALKLWQAQADAPPVLFNRGMASLFLGQRGAARTALEDACAGLAESSSWHHLASVYRTLAELE
jgi:hypothetical protein